LLDGFLGHWFEILDLIDHSVLRLLCDVYLESGSTSKGLEKVVRPHCLSSAAAPGCLNSRGVSNRALLPVSKERALPGKDGLKGWLVALFFPGAN
jgi:hypothetical protein